MSSSSSEKEILHSCETSHFSISPVFSEKPSKIMESNSMPNVSTHINSQVTLSHLDLTKTLLRSSSEPLIQEELSVGDRTWFPELKRTKSLLKDELEILKINMSVNDTIVPLKRSQVIKRLRMQVNSKKRMSLRAKNRVSCFKTCGIVGTKDLIYEIEKSEVAKRDKIPWKFLKRGSALRREFINSNKLAFEIHVFHHTDYILNSRYQNIQPVKITCPNCLFYVTTAIKNIKTIRFKFISAISATVGCIFPDVFYTFRDTVHLCPLCKIYLGFCPTYRIRNKKSLSAIRLSLSKYMTKRENYFGRERKYKKTAQEHNLITAAKNFALQEAAIENSETNLKKLKLLTTHINNQLDSLHNSSSKMEVVLEQVRSMQR